MPPQRMRPRPETTPFRKRLAWRNGRCCPGPGSGLPRSWARPGAGRPAGREAGLKGVSGGRPQLERPSPSSGMHLHCRSATARRSTLPRPSSRAVVRAFPSNSLARSASLGPGRARSIRAHPGAVRASQVGASMPSWVAAAVAKWAPGVRPRRHRGSRSRSATMVGPPGKRPLIDQQRLAEGVGFELRQPAFGRVQRSPGNRSLPGLLARSWVAGSGGVRVHPDQSVTIL